MLLKNSAGKSCGFRFPLFFEGVWIGSCADFLKWIFIRGAEKRITQI